MAPKGELNANGGYFGWLRIFSKEGGQTQGTKRKRTETIPLNVGQSEAYITLDRLARGPRPLHRPISLLPVTRARPHPKEKYVW